MEAVGALGFPLPQPKPVLVKPHSAPRIAGGFLEAILIEVTRPVGEAFSVRIFDEDHTPPSADVVATYVFYSVSVPAVARRLVIAWNALNLKSSVNLPASTFVTYDHERGFSAVISTIDALQESYLP
jgi:hypothetical protein